MRSGVPWSVHEVGHALDYGVEGGRRYAVELDECLAYELDLLAHAWPRRRRAAAMWTFQPGPARRVSGCPNRSGRLPTCDDGRTYRQLLATVGLVGDFTRYDSDSSKQLCDNVDSSRAGRHSAPNICPRGYQTVQRDLRVDRCQRAIWSAGQVGVDQVSSRSGRGWGRHPSASSAVSPRSLASTIVHAWCATMRHRTSSAPSASRRTRQ
jgi:hypothetical protein